jgi:hypothetical protein
MGGHRSGEAVWVGIVSPPFTREMVNACDRIRSILDRTDAVRIV